MGNEAYYLDSTVPAWVSFLDGHEVVGTSPPPPRAFGDPGQGSIYWGQTNVDGSAPNSPSTLRETTYGKRVGVSRDYFNNGTYAACLSAIAADLAVGRLPWKSIKLSASPFSSASGPSDWSAFASGTGNAAFAAFLANIDAIGKGPVMITLVHEPNTTTSPPADAAAHLAMYTQAKTMTDAYPQILLTPCMLAGYDIVNRLGFRFVDWIGNAWDVAGFDSYNRRSFNLDGTTSPITVGGANGKKFLTVAQMVGLQAAQIRAIDPVKPWALGEWGVRTNPNIPGEAATFMQQLFDFARTSGGFALSYFDSGTNVNDGGSPWFLDDRDTERLDKFKAILNGAHSAFIPPGGLTAP